tara:strand:+ start:17285 stop:18874 length:1590 start_codon:yes stop_codon:yes gene_type:complete
MKAVIYARYSTDKQSESSIEDQIRLCKVRLDYEGWNLGCSYKDEGVSGSTPVAHRIGGVQLLADAMASKFDVLVLEGLDRLSRDLVEQETIIRRLEHRGIRILGLSDGYDSSQKGRQLVRGMRGLINEMYLEDLKAKTHRGMTGQVARGFAAGAAPFGYENVKTESGSIIQIEPESAATVQWVFEEFALGRSPKSIVSELNERKVKSPRCSSWGVSSLYGSPAKGTGVLHNEMYIGRHIWNRSQWIKDPDTGKRIRVERPESEWCINAREDLRIISNELWEKSRLRFKTPSIKGGVKGKGGRVRSLLGGLLACDKCGAPVVVVSSHSYGCSNRMNRGASICEGVNVNRQLAEKKLLDEIRELMLSEELVEYAYIETMRILNGLMSDKDLSRDSALKRIDELDKEINRYVEAIGAIGISDSIVKKLKAAEEEKKSCELTLAEKKSEAVLPDLALIKGMYRDKVGELQESLKDNVLAAREQLKEIFGEVRISKEGEEIYALIKTNPVTSLPMTGSVGMVAGAGFEPTTFGL